MRPRQNSLESKQSQMELSNKEQLELQQLQQIEFWRTHHRRYQSAALAMSSRDVSVANHWELTRNVALHSWQRQCVDNWFAAGKRGVVKVVTGAGKTMLALAIIERLQQTTAPDLRVAII